MPQSGRASLGWGTVPETWSKGSKRERKEMVVEMVINGIQDESAWSQRCWTVWERVVNRTILRTDLWKMSQARMSFVIRSRYDTFPNPSSQCLPVRLVGWRQDQPSVS